MRAAPGEVLHFSEDPAIERFVPHIAQTARVPGAYVWAADAERCPDYWFPRQCPRAMAWVEPSTTPEDRDRVLGPGGGERVHAIEHGWVAAMSSVRLYAYRFDARDFTPHGSPVVAAMVATTEVVPIGPTDVVPIGPPEPVGDLWDLHAAAGIQIRVLPSLHAFWADVITTSLGWSGIRLRNASS